MSETYSIEVSSEELKALVSLVDKADDKMRELNCLGATDEMKAKQRMLYNLYINLLYANEEEQS